MVAFTRMTVHRVTIVVSLLTLLVAGGPTALHAQSADEDEEQVYRVETTEGESVVGILRSEKESEIVLWTRDIGEVIVRRDSIERMEPLDAYRVRDGKIWYPNPQSTRYFFATNAIGIRESEGYYQNAWIFLNNVNYGLSDNFSLGAGTIPIFLFGADAIPFWVLPKVSVSTPQESFHLAGGALFGGVLGGAETGGLGLLYGSATVGSRDHNATLGLGYGVEDGRLSDTPLINLSGMTRIGRSTYLITENYLVPTGGGEPILSAGVRWAPQNFAVDFGLIRPATLDLNGFIGIPWLGVTIPFGP